MKGFIWGLLIGAVFAFLAGVNVGKDKPVLSNPFAERPLMEEIKDTATRAVDEAKQSAQQAGEAASEAARDASQQVKESTDAAIDKAREAVHEATQPEPKKDQ